MFNYIINTIYIIILGFTVSFCKSETSFKATAQKDSSKSVSAIEAEPRDDSPDCSQSSVKLNIELLSYTIKSHNPEPIRYKLNISSCKGEKISFNGLKVFFDIDAYVDSRDFQYKIYDISNQSMPLISDTFNIIYNEDLFGKKGKIYAHHVSPPINLQHDADELIFEVFLGTTGVVSPIDPSAIGIDSYLKVGDSLPYTKKIPFSN